MSDWFWRFGVLNLDTNYRAPFDANIYQLTCHQLSMNYFLSVPNFPMVLPPSILVDSIPPPPPFLAKHINLFFFFFFWLNYKNSVFFFFFFFIEQKFSFSWRQLAHLYVRCPCQLLVTFLSRFFSFENLLSHVQMYFNFIHVS